MPAHVVDNGPVYFQTTEHDSDGFVKKLRRRPPRHAACPCCCGGSNAGPRLGGYHCLKFGTELLEILREDSRRCITLNVWSVTCDE